MARVSSGLKYWRQPNVFAIFEDNILTSGGYLPLRP